MSSPTRTPDDLLGAYEPRPGAWDDMIDRDGRLRDSWASLAPAMGALGHRELRRRVDDTARLLAADGVTYNVYGDDGSVEDRWGLDPLPSVIEADDWAVLAAGVEQRARLLDLVLTDLYGKRTLLHRGVLPPEVVFGHPAFLLACDGLRQAGASQLLLHATNVTRSADGEWVALSDRSQAPSGMGYALENRVVVSRVLAGLFRDAGVQRLAPFFRSLRAGLQAAAPATVEDPTIVVLSPGPGAATAFEHGLLARHLGYPLIEGSDLTVRDGHVWMRSLGRPVRVDVVLRRVDAWWCDPLELRGDSQLGVPGLIEAARRGHVTIVNPLGSGVLENPALLGKLGEVCRALLGEDLLLPTAPTWWCGDDLARQHVLTNLERLVLRPLDAGQDGSTTPGASLSATERDALRRRIEAAPWAWTAQEPVELSTVPAVGPDGIVAARVVFRAFTVAGPGGWEVMPGGLTRLEGDGVKTSKDTWVLATDPEAGTGYWLQDGPTVEAEPTGIVSSRIAENLFWLGRYAERAEESTRLLRVVADRTIELEETNHPEGHEALRALLRAVTEITSTYPGFIGEGAEERLAAPDAELLRLVVDVGREGSVAHAVSGLLAAARAVRDQLSGDTWLVIGALDRELADLRPDPGAATQAALGRVLQGLLALTGLVADSMVRDLGWRFLDVGRRIERSVQLLSLLRATVTTERATATDSLLFESVLVTSESIITYRRRYRSQAQRQTLLDLLLLDGGNPRSLVFQLEQLGRSLALLPSGSAATGSRLGEAERLVLEATTELRLADTSALVDARIGDHLPELDAFLGHLLDMLQRAAGAVGAASFVHLSPPQRILA